MGLVNCHECGRQISDSARSCPGCGVEFTPKTSVPRRVLRGVWYVACGLVLLVVFRSCYTVGDIIAGGPH